MEKTTIAELKRLNRSSIFHMIYSARKTSKQAIAAGLGLSLPTVTQNLRELESMQLIEKNGHFESSGGRKPQAICCVSRSRVAFGVEMTTRHLQLVCVDLYGNLLRETRIRLYYRNTREYYREMGGLVAEFISSMRVSVKKILGVGISLQGLVSPDGQVVTYGEIMGCTGARLADIAEFIPYPCRLLHDSESAAFAELWFADSIEDAIYISLSNKLGGAIILNSRIHTGKGLSSGLVEHIVAKPGGRLCYCGKRGCLDAYCSVEALCGHEREMESFFAELRRGCPRNEKQWAAYLETLASAIDNLHMVLNCDVILGGPMASYLTGEDAAILNSLAREKCTFHEARSYIRLGTCGVNVIAVGSALFYIREFLDSI